MMALAFNTRRGTGRENAMKSMQSKQWVEIMFLFVCLFFVYFLFRMKSNEVLRLGGFRFTCDYFEKRYQHSAQSKSRVPIFYTNMKTNMLYVSIL